MSESEAILIIKSYGTLFPIAEQEALNEAIQALEEISRYRDLGTVDELAEIQVQYYNYFHKVREYQKIGTADELKTLKEKLENAKEDIRKLLCSEYGSSCQFCIHDENEDAMCCNIGGSGSWCCGNARWKEH